MEVLVLDPLIQAQLLDERSESGLDRYDEVWEGVYVVSPQPNNEHQQFVGLLYFAFQSAVGLDGLGLVLPGTNVSDREDDWTKNYRCPDVAVFLEGTSARDCRTHWLGGPDFLVEVVSQYDKSREKLGFYAEVGSREVLLVDRFPWALELHRLVDGAMMLVGKSTPGDPVVLASEVLPLSFRLVGGDPRPRIEVAHVDGVQRWSA